MGDWIKALRFSIGDWRGTNLSVADVPDFYASDEEALKDTRECAG